ENFQDGVDLGAGYRKYQTEKSDLQVSATPSIIEPKSTQTHIKNISPQNVPTENTKETITESGHSGRHISPKILRLLKDYYHLYLLKSDNIQTNNSEIATTHKYSEDMPIRSKRMFIPGIHEKEQTGNQTFNHLLKNSALEQLPPDSEAVVKLNQKLNVEGKNFTIRKYEAIKQNVVHGMKEGSKFDRRVKKDSGFNISEYNTNASKLWTVRGKDPLNFLKNSIKYLKLNTADPTFPKFFHTSTNGTITRAGRGMAYGNNGSETTYFKSLDPPGKSPSKIKSLNKDKIQDFGHDTKGKEKEIITEGMGMRNDNTGSETNYFKTLDLPGNSSSKNKSLRNVKFLVFEPDTKYNEKNNYTVGVRMAYDNVAHDKKINEKQSLIKKKVAGKKTLALSDTIPLVMVLKEIKVKVNVINDNEEKSKQNSNETVKSDARMTKLSNKLILSEDEKLQDFLADQKINNEVKDIESKILKSSIDKTVENHSQIPGKMCNHSEGHDEIPKVRDERRKRMNNSENTQSYEQNQDNNNYSQGIIKNSNATTRFKREIKDIIHDTEEKSKHSSNETVKSEARRMTKPFNKLNSSKDENLQDLADQKSSTEIKDIERKILESFIVKTVENHGHIPGEMCNHSEGHDELPKVKHERKKRMNNSGKTQSYEQNRDNNNHSQGIIKNSNATTRFKREIKDIIHDAEEKSKHSSNETVKSEARRMAKSFIKLNSSKDEKLQDYLADQKSSTEIKDIERKILESFIDKTVENHGHIPGKMCNHSEGHDELPKIKHERKKRMNYSGKTQSYEQNQDNNHSQGIITNSNATTRFKRGIKDIIHDAEKKSKHSSNETVKSEARRLAKSFIKLNSSKDEKLQDYLADQKSSTEIKDIERKILESFIDKTVENHIPGKVCNHSEGHDELPKIKHERKKRMNYSGKTQSYEQNQDNNHSQGIITNSNATTRFKRGIKDIIHDAEKKSKHSSNETVKSEARRLAKSFIKLNSSKDEKLQDYLADQKSSTEIKDIERKILESFIDKTVENHIPGKVCNHSEGHDELPKIKHERKKRMNYSGKTQSYEQNQDNNHSQGIITNSNATTRFKREIKDIIHDAEEKSKHSYNGTVKSEARRMAKSSNELNSSKDEKLQDYLTDQKSSTEIKNIERKILKRFIDKTVENHGNIPGKMCNHSEGHDERPKIKNERKKRMNNSDKTQSYKQNEDNNNYSQGIIKNSNATTRFKREMNDTSFNMTTIKNMAFIKDTVTHKADFNTVSKMAAFIPFEHIILKNRIERFAKHFGNLTLEVKSQFNTLNNTEIVKNYIDQLDNLCDVLHGAFDVLNYTVKEFHKLLKLDSLQQKHNNKSVLKVDSNKSNYTKLNYTETDGFGNLTLEGKTQLNSSNNSGIMENGMAKLANFMNALHLTSNVLNNTVKIFHKLFKLDSLQQKSDNKSVLDADSHKSNSFVHEIESQEPYYTENEIKEELSKNIMKNDLKEIIESTRPSVNSILNTCSQINSIFQNLIIIIRQPLEASNLHMENENQDMLKMYNGTKAMNNPTILSLFKYTELENKTKTEGIQSDLHRFFHSMSNNTLKGHTDLVNNDNLSHDKGSFSFFAQNDTCKLSPRPTKLCKQACKKHDYKTGFCSELEYCYCLIPFNEHQSENLNQEF
ncbi:hypothetical protein L9F63_023240, partial [Diploptera punctata]